MIIARNMRKSSLYFLRGKGYDIIGSKANQIRRLNARITELNDQFEYDIVSCEKKKTDEKEFLQVFGTCINVYFYDISDSCRGSSSGNLWKSLVCMSRWNANGRNFGYTAAVPTSRLNDGNNTVKVIAVDNYGNLYDVGKITLTISGSTSQSVSYMCNMEKPVTASAIGQNTPQKLSVTVAQTDKYFELSGWAITSNGISKVVYKINNGVEKSTSSNKRSDVVSNTGIPSYKYQCDVNKIGYNEDTQGTPMMG